MSTMPHDTVRILATLAAAGLAAIGVLCFVVSGRGPEASAPAMALPGVGRVSEITWKVAGLASLWLAYHLAVYTFNLPQFRAPAWLAVTAAVGAVLASLGVDRLDNRRG